MLSRGGWVVPVTPKEDKSCCAGSSPMAGRDSLLQRDPKQWDKGRSLPWCHSSPWCCISWVGQAFPISCRQSSKLRNTQSRWWLTVSFLIHQPERDTLPVRRHVGSAGRITQQVWSHATETKSKRRKQVCIQQSYPGS